MTIWDLWTKGIYLWNANTRTIIIRLFYNDPDCLQILAFDKITCDAFRASREAVRLRIDYRSIYEV